MNAKRTKTGKHPASKIIITFFLLNLLLHLPGTAKESEVTEITIASSHEKTAQKIPVTIYTPASHIIRGNILLLPGWKHSRHRWLKETSIKKTADQYQFRLICPEMNTSVYASRYFPETWLKWSDTPGLVWVRKFLIPALQKKDMLMPGQNNFVLGLSTGGRGATLVTLDNPDLFKATAALSGDFDQTAMPEDKLMTAVYGSFAKFPERWELDNPMKQAKKWNTPLYLAHGTNDQVVPPSQTKLFYTVTHNLHVALDIKLSMPDGGHDYNFWSAETENALIFFARYAR